jgi:uncharacterized RDD family membrane protein YckC
MKITKRPEVCGICTASLWWIPTMTYFILKMNDIISSSKEWVWWLAIPIMFLIWVLLNWKITIKNDKKPSTF